ncbi:carbohydrate binding domain-containing protein [Anaerocolumna xylanovorans]|uniref:Right handed beta helix region n=1 Tax=Anaerocolumna xylanovorans DSM 12503 TaxID=1121345 RepID=A0A1M7XY34_9FIRM|nr:carbohydrate binding domain-containing protein [Anaerocolumna xylanovorans]SHO43792.1 Right handed beta helix region [Anaerocolumna xylanovorans DSM 12503]
MLKSVLKKPVSLLLVCTMLAFLFAGMPRISFAAGGATYYVDSVSGNDSNNGTSSSTPWKTVSKVNAKTFAAGDKILFKAGSVFNGQLYPLGSGAAGSPIVIDMYGTGSKPIINGGGVLGGAVKLYNQSYWEINNLEVTNTAASPALDLVGIKVFGTSTQNHIYIQNCDIHDVNGPSTGTTNFPRNDTKKTGGIDMQGCIINDVLIQNNTIHKVDRTGINAIDKVAEGSCTGVIIRNNTLYDIGGDGIIFLGASNGLVERNVCWNAVARSADANAGIWPYASDNTVFQYNECYNLALGNESNTKDSMAWDFDAECTGTIYQYNYSHNNIGGAVMTCSDNNYDEYAKNGIFRYNISQNDKTRIVRLAGQSVNFSFYNNTFYSNTGNPYVIKVDTYGGIPDKNYFYNNIFYIQNNTQGYDIAAGTNKVFDYNVFYGVHPTGEPTDAHKLTSDPLLVNPGTGGNGLTTVNGYKLQSGSPCINSGMTISNNGGKDYWGTSVPQGSVTDRGACEYTGTLTIPEVPAGLNATAAGTSQINVTWNSSSGASSYDLKVDGVIVTGVTSPYAHTGLSANTAHTYAVRAVNSAGTSAWSSIVSATTQSGSEINLVKNGNFEDAANLNYWTNASTGTATATVVTDSGSKAAKLTATSSDTARIEQVVTGLTANKTYTLTVSVKTDTGIYGYVGVQDFGGTLIEKGGTSSSGYTTYTITFITGTTNTTAKIYLHAWKQQSGSVYFDNVSIK